MLVLFIIFHKPRPFCPMEQSVFHKEPVFLSFFVQALDFSVYKKYQMISLQAQSSPFICSDNHMLHLDSVALQLS